MSAIQGTTEIGNTEDIIDSRDVIARIEYLESDEERTEEETDELTALQALAEEASDYAEDWQYGAVLIRDSYFKEFAEEFASDIGAIDRNANWPLCHIDWDAAADSLKMDYAQVEFDGMAYWVR
jgi:hypothetical protein